MIKAKRVSVVDALGGREWLRAAGLAVDGGAAGLGLATPLAVCNPVAGKPNRAVVLPLASVGFRVEYWTVGSDGEAEAAGEGIAAAGPGLKAELIKRLGLVVDSDLLLAVPVAA